MWKTADPGRTVNSKGAAAMTDPILPDPTAKLADRRKELAPDTHDVFQAFSKQGFARGAPDEKTKQLFAITVVHTTQCPYCINGHTKAVLRRGASENELMEAIRVLAEIRAGGAYAHLILAIDTAGHVHVVDI
jgi:AhpD family alkylhydroperoxidase